MLSIRNAFLSQVQKNPQLEIPTHFALVECWPNPKNLLWLSLTFFKSVKS